MNTQAEPSARQLIEAAIRAIRNAKTTTSKIEALDLYGARTTPAMIADLLAEHDAITQSQRAEIERLRAALDKYRGQTDRYGKHSAGDALTPQPPKD